VKEHGLERFARAFAEAGFVVLLHDHRNFGGKRWCGARGRRSLAADRRLAASDFVSREPARS
jgi:alpha-beta hydrolase superfamily lysophospholipase